MVQKQEKRLTLRILSLLLALAMLLPLAACGPKPAETTAATTAATTTAATTAVPEKYEIRLSAPASVEIHTALQASYLADRDPHSVQTYLKPVYTAKSVDYDSEPGTIELGRPEPITLTWTIAAEAEGHVSSFIVRLWTKEDRSDLKTVAVAALERECKVYNLFVGQTYYWNVSLTDDEGTASTSKTGTFTTAAKAPRNLYVDSVTNVRDLGGWATEDGGRVRQGLLYRGARLNDNFKTDITVSSAGIKTLCTELGIKTEVDLRQTKEVNDRNESGSRTTSPLGAAVTYRAFPMEYEAAKLITDAKNIARVREIFALLADESNYPIYFHCSIGTDRTGLISWLVNGLCGVSETDLWRDYLFSNFGTIDGSRTRAKNEDVYVNQIKAKSGANLAEKTYNFVKDYFGVPEADIDAVIRIMKEAPATK